MEDASDENCLKEFELGINLLRYLEDFKISYEKEIKEAIEIIILCHNMPEFLPKKRLNFLRSAKDSYAYNTFNFSKNNYFKYKIKQIFMFCKSYILRFNLHKKRSRFFKNFSKKEF